MPSIRFDGIAQDYSCTHKRIKEMVQVLRVVKICMEIGYSLLQITCPAIFLREDMPISATKDDVKCKDIGIKSK